MLVKLLTPRCGERFSQEYGEIVEIEAAEAARLIAAGSAEAAPPQPPRTAAAPAPPRTATKPRPR